MKLFTKPPTPFIGNKSNRRFWIVDFLTKLLNADGMFDGKPTMSFDMFGGSFYLTHLMQLCAIKSNLKLKSYINDYDGYVKVFMPEFIEHGLVVKGVCDRRTDLKRGDLLSPEDCQEIDSYIDQNCPEYKLWFRRFLSNYGDTDKYRKRLTDHQTMWKGINIQNYVPNSAISEELCDWEDWLTAVTSSLRTKLKAANHIWLIDPPYSTYGSGILYGTGKEPLDISLSYILNKLFEKVPNALVMSFGYVRNVDCSAIKLDGSLHREEVLEFFPHLGGLRTSSRPEYAHLWWVGDNDSERSTVIRNVANSVPRVLDRRKRGWNDTDAKGLWQYTDEIVNF